MINSDLDILINLLEKLLASPLAREDNIVHRTTKGLIKKLQTLK